MPPPAAIPIDPFDHDGPHPSSNPAVSPSATPPSENALTLTHSNPASLQNGSSSPSDRGLLDDRDPARSDPTTTSSTVSAIRSSTAHDAGRPRIAASSSAACSSVHEQPELEVVSTDGKVPRKRSPLIYHARGSSARHGATVSNGTAAGSCGMTNSHNVSSSSPSHSHVKNFKPKPTIIGKRDSKSHSNVISSCAHRISSSSGANVAVSTGTRPRKRFRKKVSGLFGENTDLNKRMSKLIRETDISKIKIGPDAADADLLLRHRQPAGALMDTGNLLSRLPEHPSSADSFDYKELTAAATKALGSPEKLAKVRKAMGTLDPADNERFLDALELGHNQLSDDPCVTEMANKDHLQDDIFNATENVDCDEKLAEPSNDQPPKLAPLQLKFTVEPETEMGNLVDRVVTSTTSTKPAPESPQNSAKTFFEKRRNIIMQAIPAVLRSKTRRADRGYRSKDVVEARLKAGKSNGPNRSRSVPGIVLPIRKISSTSSSRRFATGSSGHVSSSRHCDNEGIVQGRRRKRGDGYSEYCMNQKSQDQEHNSNEYQVKRRRRVGPAEIMNDDDLEGSPVTLATTTSDQDHDEDDDGEDDADDNSNEDDDDEDDEYDSNDNDDDDNSVDDDHAGDGPSPRHRIGSTPEDVNAHNNYRDEFGSRCNRVPHDPLSMLVEAATGHQSVEEDEIQIERRRNK